MNRQTWEQLKYKVLLPMPVVITLGLLFAYLLVRFVML